MKAAEMEELVPYAKTDVIVRILETARSSSGAPQGRILRDAYLSNVKAREYLPLMIKNDLLEYDATSKKYKVTIKGEAFLKTYRHMGEIIDLIQEEIGL